MGNKYYVCPARGCGKSQTSIKAIMDAIEDGHEVVFVNHPPRYGKTASDPDALDKIRKYVYDLHAIKEPDPRMEEYFHHLYPIEPPKPIPMDTEVWLKANPCLTMPLLNNDVIINIKLEEKGNVNEKRITFDI